MPHFQMQHILKENMSATEITAALAEMQMVLGAMLNVLDASNIPCIDTDDTTVVGGEGSFVIDNGQISLYTSANLHAKGIGRNKHLDLSAGTPAVMIGTRKNGENYEPVVQMHHETLRALLSGRLRTNVNGQYYPVEVVEA